MAKFATLVSRRSVIGPTSRNFPVDPGLERPVLIAYEYCSRELCIRCPSLNPADDRIAS